MNRKQRRAFNKKMKGKMTAEEMSTMNESMQRVAALNKCDNCGAILDKKNNHHLDLWKISVVNEKMILLCDECQ